MSWCQRLQIVVACTFAYHGSSLRGDTKPSGRLHQEGARTKSMPPDSSNLVGLCSRGDWRFQSRNIWALEEDEIDEEGACWKWLWTRFDFVSTKWFIYQVDGSFMARLGAAGGLAGKLKKTATTSVWREGIKKITIALVPTTLKGNKWLFNISMHSKRRRGGGITRTVMNKTKRSNKKESQRRHLCEAERKYAPRQKLSSFYLMGAAAVMHPCGPHFNNWTDIGAAPAGSLNHCRGFEQTAVTLRDQARPKKTQTEGKKEEKKKKEEEEKKDAFKAVNMALGYRVMSTSPWRLHRFAIWKLFRVLINPKCVIYLWKGKKKAADIPLFVAFSPRRKATEITPTEACQRFLRCRRGTLRSPRPPLPLSFLAPQITKSLKFLVCLCRNYKTFWINYNINRPEICARWICIKVHTRPAN